MSGKTELTIEEAVATLVRSGLPTVIAEGDEDFLVLRGVEERCADLGVSIFPVGGKEKALCIWRELPEDRRVDTLVVIDRDMWLFEGMPDDYSAEQIVATKGFSIENDLCDDWHWDQLMSAEEKAQFAAELQIVCRWFGWRVSRKMAGEDVTIADHPNRILQDPDTPCDDPLDIHAEYVLRLRGKTLVELATRHLSSKQRAAKYSKRSLLELAASTRGPNVTRLEVTIREFFTDRAAA